MDWKNKLQSAASAAKSSIDQDSHKKLEENWPKIQQLFQEKIGPAALAAAKDDQTFDSATAIVYEALPFPIKLLVKPDAFHQFCSAHRDRLLAGNPAAE